MKVNPDECPFINDLCMTISGHFFAICIFIFQETEILTVILMCFTGLNLDWFKCYGLKCSLRPHASSANSQKLIFSRTSKLGSDKNKKSLFFLLGLKCTLKTCFEYNNFSSNSCPELSNQLLSFSACQIY